MLFQLCLSEIEAVQFMYIGTEDGLEINLLSGQKENTKNQ